MTLSVLLSLVGFLLTIGIVVMIHEGGHYLAAKWLGFGVKRFSIGMGRVLWRRRAWDTEFAVSLLPIGGYVAFEEADELREQGREPTGVLFDSGPRWKKAIVVTAGPLMNFVLAVILFTASGAIGVRDIAPYVEPAPASQAQTQGVGAMDLVTATYRVGGPALDGRRIVGVMDFNSALLEHTGKADVPVTFSRAKTGESYVRHFDLSGLSLDEAAKTNGFVLQKLGFLLAGRGVTILKVEADGPAAAAGPKHGELVQKNLVKDYFGSRADMQGFAAAIRTSPEKTVQLSVNRAGTPVEISLVPKRILDEKTQSAVGRAELRFGPGIEFVTVRLTPLQSLETAFDKVVGLTRFQAAAVGGMAKGEVSTENLSGPVGIAGMAGSALTAGVSAFLEFVALISIAIGFMNLIPIPALDGGQLVILGIEGLMGRSLARGLKEKLGAVSMALLLLLAVYVTMNDIGRLGG